METKTAGQEYESYPHMENFRDKEQMELSDIRVICKDNKITRKADGAFEGLTDFCIKSNLHGLKYVGEKNNHICVRILWAVAFVIAVLTATFFIRNVYNKWEESPVIVSVDSRMAEIDEIPFPAVTICPPLVLTKHYANQLLARKNKSHEFKLRLIETFCGSERISNLYDGSRETSDFLTNFEENLKLKCEDIFKKAHMGINFKTTRYIYNDYVSISPTAHPDSRFCCTFNGMKPELMYRNITDNYLINNAPNTSSFDWNVETGYNTLVKRTTMPLRPFNTGFPKGLSIYINLNDTYCNRRTYFQMCVHHPGEATDFRSLDFSPVTGGMFNYKIVPQLTRAAETLRNVEVRKRNCYFSSETYLRFYRTYTQKNCFLDCLANITLKECHCLPIYLPEMNGVPFCIDFLYLCFNNLYFSVMEGDRHDECNCLPPCTELKYSVTAQYSPLSDIEQYNKLQIYMYYTEWRFYHYHRSAIYTFSEMLANLGGLLGLFLGFSFLTIVEIFYFSCVGIWKFLRGQWRDIRSKCYSDKHAV